MWAWIFQIAVWALVGAAVLGYLGFMVQITVVGFIATGFILMALLGLGG